VLPDGSAIRLVAPACFLATKLAAFGDRGRGRGFFPWMAMEPDPDEG